MAASEPVAATTAPAAPPKTEPELPTTTTTTELPSTDAAIAPGEPSQDTTAKDAAPPAPAVTTAAPNGVAVAPSAELESSIPSKDDTNPLDFQGDVQTNNNLPSAETLRKLEKYTVLDESGKSHTFKSLYTGANVPRRVLIIFIRHFFCGVSPLLSFL
jgi:hypothetical protein